MFYAKLVLYKAQMFGELNTDYVSAFANVFIPLHDFRTGTYFA